MARAAVQDTDESIAEGAEGLMVGGAASSLAVVVRQLKGSPPAEGDPDDASAAPAQGAAGQPGVREPVGAESSSRNTTDNPTDKDAGVTVPASGGTRAGGRSVPVLVPAIARVPLPSVHLARVPIPRVPVPHLTVRPLSVSHLPGAPRPTIRGSRGRWLWWGGLAGAAGLGVIEWPVAAAVAIGSYVAERAASAGQPTTSLDTPA